MKQFVNTVILSVNCYITLNWKLATVAIMFHCLAGISDFQNYNN